MDEVQTPAEREKVLTLAFLHEKLDALTACLNEIEHAEILDWAVYAEQSNTAAAITEDLTRRFSWMADVSAGIARRRADDQDA